jgi:uncharacterized protein (DUF1015 family)
MPLLYPFKALRPANEYIGRVSAKSTDFKSKKALGEELRSNPYSFHNVTKNHLNYTGAFQEPEKFLPFAAKFVEDAIEKGVLLRDEDEAFYIYEQSRKDGKKFIGIVGLYTIDDYRNNKIKKHENIRPNKIKFVTQMFRTTKVMGEPVLLACAFKEALDYSTKKEVSRFTSVDGKTHVISAITDKNAIEKIQNNLGSLDAFYIADGHHRSESAYDYRNNYPNDKNDKAMCLLMDENDLEIHSFHRLIRNIDTISEEDFFNKLGQSFKVEKADESIYNPKETHVFGMYKAGQWYKLTYLHESDDIDVDVLEEHVVRAVFGIKDSRTDSQISFHSDFEGKAKLLKLVDNDTFRVAFTIKPCSFEDVRVISDRNEVMPPKSTYIEPKLRTGMVIAEI